MDLTKEKIEEWVANHYADQKILELNIESGEQFFLLLRCKLGEKEPEKFIKTFVDRLSRFTLTNWIVHGTYPSMQRMLFRKTYICHHSNHNKATKSERQNVNKRNKECKAKIDFKVKKITRHTCKNDKLLVEGLNCAIKVNFRHSHSVRSLESFGLLRCSARTKRKFREYYKLGMLPFVAKAYNEIQIRAKYYDEKQREIQLANGIINPNMRCVDRFYYTWKKQNREFVFDSFAKLKEEKDTIEAGGAYLKIHEKPKIIVILTEFTKKVFLKFGEEIFIDSGGCEGKEVNYKTSIFVPTKIGALPIGYILHNGRTDEEYEQGFKVFAEALKEYCAKDLKPKVVMTSDGEQLDELARIFPKSSIELCAYTNFSQFWDFLSGCNSKVQKDNRKRLMTQYFNILTCQSRTECESMLQQMKNDPEVKSILDLKEIVNRLWLRREDWLPRVPEHASVRDAKTLTSTHMRIYHNVVCKHFRKFNSYALVKLFTGPINDIYKMYLMQYALNGVATTPIFNLFYDTGDYNIIPLAPKEYMVQSLTDLDQVHTVYTDIMLCTCRDGSYGYYCKHLCAVEKAFPFHPTPTIDELDRDFYNCPEMAPGIREAIQKAEESEDDLDQDDANDSNPVERPVDNDETGGNDDFDETNNDDFDETNNDDLHESESNDDDETTCRDNIKVEVARSSGTTKVNSNGNAPSSLVDKVHTIMQGLSKTKSKSKALKRTHNALKRAIESETGSAVTSAASNSKRPRSDTSQHEAIIISKGWGLIYKKLAPSQKIYAKKAIDDILFEASLGTLGRNSVTITQNTTAIVEIDPFEVKDEVNDDSVD